MTRPTLYTHPEITEWQCTCHRWLYVTDERAASWQQGTIADKGQVRCKCGQLWKVLPAEDALWDGLEGAHDMERERDYTERVKAKGAYDAKCAADELLARVDLRTRTDNQLKSREVARAFIVASVTRKAESV